MTTVFQPGILSGRKALITGGGSGIGAGIVRTFAKHGAKVAIVGRTKEKLDKVAAETGASVHPADVRDYKALEAAVHAAAAAMGGIDILVNSAAGNFLVPAAALSANGFRAVVDIDLCGTFNASRACFEWLSKSGGSIVNITADLAHVARPLQCHAGAAKAGIEKLTKDLALEWARFGIRVNAVAPGPIADTEGMSRLAPPGIETFLKKRVPLGRAGTIDEVADTVLFLVSNGGAYITGTTILVDGGSSLIGAGPFLELLDAQNTT